MFVRLEVQYYYINAWHCAVVNTMYGTVSIRIVKPAGSMSKQVHANEVNWSHVILQLLFTSRAGHRPQIARVRKAWQGGSRARRLLGVDGWQARREHNLTVSLISSEGKVKTNCTKHRTQM